MKRFILPLIFVIAAVGIFFGFIDPRYQNVQELRGQQADLDEALQRARELQEVRDDLLSQYNTFSEQNTRRVRELLPDNIDNVRLALDIDHLAASYQMRIQDIQIEETSDGSVSNGEETTDASGARNAGQNGTGGGSNLGPDTNPFGTAKLSFTVNSPYEPFKAFLRSLENSLRLVDVTSVAFAAGDDGQRSGESGEGERIYEYEVSIQTYWLKSDL